MDSYQPPAQFPNPQNIHPIPFQDPQARYSQLPPGDDHQNISIQYPQQQQGQVPLINQVNQQDNVSPSQYAGLRANPDFPNARILLKKNIRDIEARLEKGWFYLYKLWLGVLNFFSGFDRFCQCCLCIFSA